MARVRELLPNRTNAELTQLVTSSHFIECVDKYQSMRARQRAQVNPSADASVDGAVVAAGVAANESALNQSTKPMSQSTKRTASMANQLTPSEFRKRVCERMEHQIELCKTKNPSVKWTTRRLETISLKMISIAEYNAKAARSQATTAKLHVMYLENKRVRVRVDGDVDGDDDDEE
jgi:hypothetical protein